MAFQIMLRKEQVENLKLLYGLGAKAIKEITEEIKKKEPVILEPSQLYETLINLTPGSAFDKENIANLIVGLYNIRRKSDIEIEDLLKSLKEAVLSDDLSEEERSRWDSAEPVLGELLSIQSIGSAVKAIDLSYDYANICRGAKIITDIRPVFDEEPSDIIASIISYCLRLNYESRDGIESLSIALDEQDIMNLKKNCERALKKGKIAKEFMEKKGGVKTCVCGE